jgi:NAD(P)-dependent dehydrogenase (short-subunit alcohol dehydrogenase family)
MTQRLTALITGANRGIGLQTAKELAKRGFTVFVGARDAGAGERAAAEVGGDAVSLTLDVSDSASIQRAAHAFGERSDRLDLLVNNAGIYADKGVTILDISRELLATTFQTNTFGPIAVTQAFLPFLRKASAPRVINVSSGYGQLDGLLPQVPSYCLSKLALNGVTIMLAEALKSDHVAVNSVCPGWVRTDMGGANAVRSVEEGADTIVWLAADAPHELTGKFFRDRHEIPW